MSGAHVNPDSGVNTQPLTLLGPGLCLESVAVGAPDGRLGEHRVTKESAAARFDARERLAVVDHPREPHVVTGPPGDQRDITATGLVEGDRVGVCLTDPRDGLISTAGYSTSLR